MLSSLLLFALLIACFYLIFTRKSRGLSHDSRVEDITAWKGTATVNWGRRRGELKVRVSAPSSTPEYPVYSLLTFTENSELLEYQIICLFLFPCHLAVSHGIILYWLSYLPPPHSIRYRFPPLTSRRACPRSTCLYVIP